MRVHLRADERRALYESAVASSARITASDALNGHQQLLYRNHKRIEDEPTIALSSVVAPLTLTSRPGEITLDGDSVQ